MNLGVSGSSSSGAPPFVGGGGCGTPREFGGGCSTDLLLDLELKTDGLVCAPAVYEMAGLSSCGLTLSRNRLVITPPDLLPSHVRAQPHIKSYKIVIKTLDGELVWVRPFLSQNDAAKVWVRLIGTDRLIHRDEGIYFPNTVIDGDFAYYFATVETFNSTPGGGTWTVPVGVFSTDYLVVGGGGGGGRNAGGGGGAGGFRTATGYATTPGAALTLTVGTGGGGATSDTSPGSNGNNSVFDTITSTGGGGGGSGGSVGAAPGANGGSGGGGAGNGTTPGGGGTGTGGQGNNGGLSQSGAGAGGGGASAVGGAGNGGTSTGGNGGAGTASSISGGSVTYAGGGGGRSTNNGSGGAGGGGAAGATGTAGTANTGGGGGASASGTAGANGGSGIVILSYTPIDTLMGQGIF